MLRHEINLPPGTDPSRLGLLVEDLCREKGLAVGLKTHLSTYPGSIHWHWKRGRQRGTLEITHWPQANRLWISVHENRAAFWTEDAAARLAKSLEEQLSRGSGTIAEQKPS